MRILVPLVALLAVACTSGSGIGGPSEGGREAAAASAGKSPVLTPTPATTPTPAPAPAPTSTLIPAGADLPRPYYAGPEWKTDFSKHSVKYSEIIAVRPPRDAIPPLDDPEFFLLSDVENYMPPEWPVLSLEINGEARAYPLAILIWHEIVNDEVGGVPVAITYCPLCNTAIVFDRRVDGTVLDFGTSGLLRNSDLVMWDRQTESWWQQITGEAIVGELTGARLSFLPATVVSWGEFRRAFPDGQLLSRETGFGKAYGQPPYIGYDDTGSAPFAFTGSVDSRLDAMERVVGLNIGGRSVAYPFALLEQHPVVNDSVNGEDVVVFFGGETLSPFSGALTPDIKRGSNRVVGSTGVFEPFIDGRKLTFTLQGDEVVDEETGSTWNIFGLAVDGALAGRELTPVVHANHFWFAWAAFNADTTMRTVEELD